MAASCIGGQLADLSEVEVARLVDLLHRFVTAPAAPTPGSPGS